MDELDKRVAGTELEAMIPKSAGGQRAAVQGTFNQAAAAFQLLPAEQEAQGRWSAAAWAKRRSGWIFLPSSPTLRDSLRPLLSMWLDSLILRLMESSQNGSSRIWFILDELSSLQRLPQLPTAITESRKSNICLVIGFQGRSQLETLYGHQAEAMLSQPMTKVFLRTSEPHAAEWVSRSIGEVEVMRLEETHSQSVPAFLGHRGKSSRVQRHIEPLVMASTIEGLHNLTGYLKSRDLVVPARFPYLQLQTQHPAFVPRSLPELAPLILARSVTGPVTSALQEKETSAPQQNVGRSHEGSAELEIFD
jgi:type IV secretory pathway TraG/TraD family ATPase VirD4